MPVKKCEHGISQYKCKDCKGGGICDHMRQRYYCKDCGGAGICIHDRIKYSCKECKGAGICAHQNLRSNCLECAEASLKCQHRRLKAKCFRCLKDATGAFAKPNEIILPGRTMDTMTDIKTGVMTEVMTGTTIRKTREVKEMTGNTKTVVESLLALTPEELEYIRNSEVEPNPKRRKLEE